MAPNFPQKKQVAPNGPASHNYNLRPRVKAKDRPKVSSYISINSKLPSCSKSKKVSSKRAKSAAINCIICLDTQANTNQTEMSCGHSFHEECINMWLSKKNTCPVCRAIISTDQPPPERDDFDHVFLNTFVAIFMMTWMNQE